MHHRDAMRLTDEIAKAGLADVRLTFEKIPNPRKKPPFDWDYDYGADAIDPDTSERIAFASRADFLARYPPRSSSPNPPRTLNLIVRATPAEKARVQALADEAGQTVSDYIRSRIGL